MSEKTLKTRIQNKRGTTAEWATGTAPNFVPLDGELVIYKDVNKIKIGDGSTKVGDLPFVASNGLDALTCSSLINVQTKPQVGHTFSYGPVSDSSFNRTPVVGDVLNVLVNHQSNSDSYMCTVEVTEYAPPILRGTYVNVTQATGKDGTGIGDITNFTLGKTTSVSYNSIDGARFIGQSSFTDKNGNTFNQASATTLPITGGNGIIVDSAEDGKSLEVRVGDTITLENQRLSIETPESVAYVKLSDNKMDLDGSGTTWITINGNSESQAIEQICGTSIFCDAAIGSSGEVTDWRYINAYYAIAGVPTSSTSGTLPDDVSWRYLTAYPHKLRIKFNNEFYQLADDEHTPGTLVFSHVGYENDQLIVKTITITIATRGWVLTTTYPGDGKVKDVTLGGESIVGNDGIVKLEKTVMTNGYVPVWNNTEGIFEDGIEKSNIATIYRIPDKHFQPFAVGDDLSGQTLYFNNQAHYSQYFIAQHTILTSSGGYSIVAGGPPDITLKKNGTIVATFYTYSNSSWLESYTLPSDFGTVETLDSKGGPEELANSKPSIWYTLGLGPAEDYTNIDVEDVYNDIKTVRSKIPAVIDYLTNSSTTDALSANQGRVLNLNKAPNNHASTATTYGVGTSANYGHVKVISGDLNGKTPQDGYAASQSHTHSQYALKANPTFTGNATIGGNLTVNGTAIGGNLTVSGTATFQNEVRVNSSAGTLGQVLMSQGGGNSPQWKDIPVPSNMVTTDTEQTITGVKRFASSSNQYPRTIIDNGGIQIQPSQKNNVAYSTSIVRLINGSPITINLPSSGGTLALTNQIPIKTATLSGTTLSITLS